MIDRRIAALKMKTTANGCTIHEENAAKSKIAELSATQDMKASQFRVDRASYVESLWGNPGSLQGLFDLLDPESMAIFRDYLNKNHTNTATRGE